MWKNTPSIKCYLSTGKTRDVKVPRKATAKQAFGGGIGHLQILLSDSGLPPYWVMEGRLLFCNSGGLKQSLSGSFASLL
jgi:hypothetical protein